MDVFLQVANHTKAVIEDISILGITINNTICHLLPEKALKFVKSNQELYNSPKAVLISHSTHPQVVDFFLYRSLTGIKFDIAKGTFSSRIDGALDVAGIIKSLKRYVCTDTLQGYLYRDMDISKWNPLPLFFFKRFLYICIGIIFCAIIVSVIEIIHKYFRKIRRIKKVRPVFAKVITLSTKSLAAARRVSSASIVRTRESSSCKT